MCHLLTAPQRPSFAGFAPVEQRVVAYKPGSLLIEVTTKVMKLTESIKKKKVKKERGGAHQGAGGHPFTQ